MTDAERELLIFIAYQLYGLRSGFISAEFARSCTTEQHLKEQVDAIMNPIAGDLGRIVSEIEQEGEGRGERT